jgi:hypothetical protein
MGDDLTRGDRPVKSLQENYIEMVKAQQFDGTVICKLQRELAHLRRENAWLREALAASGYKACPYRLAVLHVGQKDIEYHECKMVAGHSGFHRTDVEGVERYFGGYF